jgi:hypothetical protein
MSAFDFALRKSMKEHAEVCGKYRSSLLLDEELRPSEYYVRRRQQGLIVKQLTQSILIISAKP